MHLREGRTRGYKGAAMIVLTFEGEDGLRLGVRTARGVVDVREASRALHRDGVPADPSAFFGCGVQALPVLRDLVARATQSRNGAAWLRDEASLTLGPSVPAPGKIICIGLNYRRHAAEAGMEPPAQPVLFSKFGNAVAASGEPVPIPPHASEIDYESELAVVIGRTARRVPTEAALDHVLGYCNANDLSARDLQFLTGQWLLGKTLDKFLPLGPWLVTADDVGDPQDLPIRGWLNGELRQSSSTSDMIFGVAEIVSYVSRHLTLEPGDVIATGTPEGVIFGRPVKEWMKPGDEFTVEIGPLGRLANRLVADTRE
jgi:2-keto-4-pentenoate hydratase/2-oxohepta-3-ene-1,7-dioic acid hydratase in catechol pathway